MKLFKLKRGFGSDAGFWVFSISSLDAGTVGDDLLPALCRSGEEENR
jgi:hypothetical protein